MSECITAKDAVIGEYYYYGDNIKDVRDYEEKGIYGRLIGIDASDSNSVSFTIDDKGTYCNLIKVKPEDIRHTEDIIDGACDDDDFVIGEKYFFFDNADDIDVLDDDDIGELTDADDDSTVYPFEKDNDECFSYIYPCKKVKDSVKKEAFDMDILNHTLSHYELGKRYFFADSITLLKKFVEQKDLDMQGILHRYDADNSCPFVVDGCGRWGYIYPVIKNDEFDIRLLRYTMENPEKGKRYYRSDDLSSLQESVNTHSLFGIGIFTNVNYENSNLPFVFRGEDIGWRYLYPVSENVIEPTETIDDSKDDIINLDILHNSCASPEIGKEYYFADSTDVLKRIITSKIDGRKGILDSVNRDLQCPFKISNGCCHWKYIYPVVSHTMTREDNIRKMFHLSPLYKKLEEKKVSGLASLIIERMIKDDMVNNGATVRRLSEAFEWGETPEGYSVWGDFAIFLGE